MAEDLPLDKPVKRFKGRSILPAHKQPDKKMMDIVIAHKKKEKKKPDVIEVEEPVVANATNDSEPEVE